MIKKIIWLLLVVVVTVGVVLLINKSSNGKKDSDQPIRIGAVISLTGVAADFGENAKKAMEMAVEDINKDGGIDGRMVELYVEDDHTVPKDAVSAWRKVVDVDNVDAVVGGLFDFTAQPLFPLNENEKITFISPINFTIPNSFEMNDHSFVMYPKFEKVIAELGTVVADKKVAKLGMIRYQSDFGAEIERVLNKITTDLKLPTLVTETYAVIGGTDFRTPILKLKDAGVDTIFVDMLDFDIVTYLKRANELGFKPRMIGYTTVRDALKNPDLDKSLMEGAIMLDWEIPSAEFSQKFEEKYGVPPRRGNNKAYDAVYVLAEAIANSDSRADVAGYIAKNSFETINGKFNFTTDHSIENTPVKVFEVKSGQFVEIKSN